MRKIFKYTIPFMEVSKVLLPVGAKIVRVDGLDGFIFLWAVIDPLAPIEQRTFHLFKTGADMPDDIAEYTYHGCGAIFVQMELMMYVYEDMRVKAVSLPEVRKWEGWVKFRWGE